ncbi:CocE/NonD family hydrolase [Millisia brevis]|uniref:CocE/NonD family hydrolase n=1 Tax=Millisia brevis TaxID=264148 RepID=UPI000A05E15E|nr:CocE/NonD family hydrolase [Millisia brevis]
MTVDTSPGTNRTDRAADRRTIDPRAYGVTVRDVAIPMPDGVRLHARVWLPADTATRAVPALLEYLPYRLDDWTSVRDSERHPWYAARGYASVRVDIRGTGSSEGFFDDEYSEQELADGEAVIAWIAEQPWCTGRVGMFGISWGGFNCLQLAARRPAALHAIVTCCSTDDRYDNDVHYVGGAVLGIDMSAWAATMLAFTARPPRPEVVGPEWIDQWRARLEHLRPLAPVWLGHQRRDDYWRRGSVCEDYRSVTAAVLAVGGWSDPYRDTVFRLLENLEAPRKGLLGPWPHQYPDRDTTPGPMIDFLSETLRWWDRWLADEPTGVEDDPDLKVWIQQGERPAPHPVERLGRWIGVETWPSAMESVTLPLAGPEAPPRIVSTPAATGQDSGRFFPFGSSTDLPPDQRAEDGRSVVFDLPQRPAGLLGTATVRLRLRTTTPRATVIVRLCEVWPDGASTLLTRGVLNLTRRNGRDRTDPMPIGEWVDVHVPLVTVGHEFAPGTRLRVAISDHYWPWVWPHEDAGPFEIDPAASQVRLPTIPDGLPVTFDSPEQARPLAAVPVPTPDRPNGPRAVTFDVATGRTRLVVDPEYGGSRRYPDGLLWLESTEESYDIVEGDPLSPRADARWSYDIDGDGWGARITTGSSITCAPGEFVIDNRVHALARDASGAWHVVHDGVYTDRVARDGA